MPHYIVFNMKHSLSFLYPEVTPNFLETGSLAKENTEFS